jgi:hypothetical protein
MPTNLQNSLEEYLKFSDYDQARKMIIDSIENAVEQTIIKKFMSADSKENEAAKKKKPSEEEIKKNNKLKYKKILNLTKWHVVPEGIEIDHPETAKQEKVLDLAKTLNLDFKTATELTEKGVMEAVYEANELILRMRFNTHGGKHEAETLIAAINLYKEFVQLYNLHAETEIEFVLTEKINKEIRELTRPFGITREKEAGKVIPLNHEGNKPGNKK